MEVLGWEGEFVGGGRIERQEPRGRQLPPPHTHTHTLSSPLAIPHNEDRCIWVGGWGGVKGQCSDQWPLNNTAEPRAHQ